MGFEIQLESGILPVRSTVGLKSSALQSVGVAAQYKHLSEFFRLQKLHLRSVGFDNTGIVGFAAHCENLIFTTAKSSKLEDSVRSIFNLFTSILLPAPQPCGHFKYSGANMSWTPCTDY